MILIMIARPPGGPAAAGADAAAGPVIHYIILYHVIPCYIILYNVVVYYICVCVCVYVYTPNFPTNITPTNIA